MNGSLKFDYVLWAYRIVFKTLITISPYLWKSCHLPFELKHKAYWAIQELNFDGKTCGERRLLKLNELVELRLNDYENTKLYKEGTKLWHPRRMQAKHFEAGHQHKTSRRCDPPHFIFHVNIRTTRAQLGQ